MGKSTTSVNSALTSKHAGTGFARRVIGSYYPREAYGRDCLAQLRGMFAFTVWDARTRVLLLARDRVGKKPCFIGLAVIV